MWVTVYRFCKAKIVDKINSFTFKGFRTPLKLFPFFRELTITDDLREIDVRVTSEGQSVNISTLFQKREFIDYRPNFDSKKAIEVNTRMLRKYRRYFSGIGFDEHWYNLGRDFRNEFIRDYIPIITDKFYTLPKIKDTYNPNTNKGKMVFRIDKVTEFISLEYVFIGTNGTWGNFARRGGGKWWQSFFKFSIRINGKLALVRKTGVMARDCYHSYIFEGNIGNYPKNTTGSASVSLDDYVLNSYYELDIQNHLEVEVEIVKMYTVDDNGNILNSDNVYIKNNEITELYFGFITYDDGKNVYADNTSKASLYCQENL